MDATLYISIGIVTVVAIILIIKKLMSLGVRILMGILIIAFMVFVTPKINTFLINKLETGVELEDEALLEQLKTEAYHVDQNLSDDLNILMNCGLPAGIENTILVNVQDHGIPKIQADTFADYVAKFFVLRLTTLISILISFSVATNTFVVDQRKKYLC